VELIRAYLSFDAYRAFGPLVDSLNGEEDDQRRYTFDNEVQIETPDGVSIAAVLVRPKSAAKPLPTLLEFTIYDSQKLRQGMRRARLRRGSGLRAEERIRPASSGSLSARRR
jgi:uncharacterized protein